MRRAATCRSRSLCPVAAATAAVPRSCRSVWLGGGLRLRLTSYKAGGAESGADVPGSGASCGCGTGWSWGSARGRVRARPRLRVRAPNCQTLRGRTGAALVAHGACRRLPADSSRPRSRARFPSDGEPTAKRPDKARFLSLS